MQPTEKLQPHRKQLWCNQPKNLQLKLQTILYWKGEDKVVSFPLVFYNLMFYTIQTVEGDLFIAQ